MLQDLQGEHQSDSGKEVTSQVLHKTFPENSYSICRICSNSLLQHMVIHKIISKETLPSQLSKILVACPPRRRNTSVLFRLPKLNSVMTHSVMTYGKLVRSFVKCRLIETKLLANVSIMRCDVLSSRPKSGQRLYCLSICLITWLDIVCMAWLSALFCLVSSVFTLIHLCSKKCSPNCHAVGRLCFRWWYKEQVVLNCYS